MILSRLLSGSPPKTVVMRTRNLRSMANCATVLRYGDYGDPLNVIERCEEPIPQPKDGEVLVKMLLASINPADINTIQGKYPDKPALPAICGNEGIGEVISLGPNMPATGPASQLKVGDHVVPDTMQSGTWRSHAAWPAAAMQLVPAGLDPVIGATLNVNPPSAYRMLRDFVQLQAGDTVLQNGGNSAVGQAVTQLCRIWGLKCISVVRDRPDVEQLKTFLRSLGAAEVLTEDEVRVTRIFKGGLPAPRLALNCVGGKAATDLVRHLADRGALVTYGAMSREPVVAPNAALIFKDIQFRGFWLSRWNRENANSAERRQMIGELVAYFESGQLRAPVHALVPIDEWQAALRASMDYKGFTGKKFLLQF